LTPRIIESAKQVTAKNCQGWILHSKSFFPRCLLECCLIYNYNYLFSEPILCTIEKNRSSIIITRTQI
ncbi:hypothetical protein BDC45DRAFT_449213, partial [Circinella umbellata]